MLEYTTPYKKENPNLDIFLILALVLVYVSLGFIKFSLYLSSTELSRTNLLIVSVILLVLFLMTFRALTLGFIQIGPGQGAASKKDFGTLLQRMRSKYSALDLPVLFGGA